MSVAIMSQQTKKSIMAMSRKTTKKNSGGKKGLEKLNEIVLKSILMLITTYHDQYMILYAQNFDFRIRRDHEKKIPCAPSL